MREQGAGGQQGTGGQQGAAGQSYPGSTEPRGQRRTGGGRGAAGGQTAGPQSGGRAASRQSGAAESGQQTGGTQPAGAGRPTGMSQQQFEQPTRNIPIEPIRTEQLAAEDVVTADPDTPVATVVAMLAEKDVGTVVVTEDDRPVGIVTDRRIALALEETPDLTERAVESVMTENPVTVGADVDLFDTVETLREHDIRRVPVVDDDGRLTGILSLDDVLVVLGDELSSAVDVIESQSPRY